MNSKDHHNYSIPVLIAAICAVSTAAPLAKFANDVHPIAIGFWRTLLVGFVLLLSIKPHQLKISLKNGSLAICAGILLAFHFWTWFASLQYTSVLRSTTLVCLNPVWAGIMEGILLQNKPSRQFWIGVTIAIMGVGLMTSGDLSDGALIGDALALLGGFLGAAYLIVGRVVRQDMAINAYGAFICLVCAASMSLLSIPMDVSLAGDSVQATWLILLAMAIGPQLTGHIGLNYCVRYLSAANISLALLLEPVGAAILAIIFLNELPSGMEILGSILILIGVGVGARK